MSDQGERRRRHDAVVVGAGFAGAVVARELAERGGMSVLLVEARSHVGGNAYDHRDDAGILVHEYGPHIFHTDDRRVFDYLSRFTEWRDYEHRVLADVHGQLMPVPFNLTSLRLAFGDARAESLTNRLIDVFGRERKVPIIDLRAQDDAELAEVADYVYRNVFLYYTQKQWGVKPEEVDPSVTARVPVFISEDDRYFQDAYQGMPAQGYTALFSRLLEHPRIELILETDARSVLELVFEDDVPEARLQEVRVGGEAHDGPIIYTGPLDQLFDLRFGQLPYRSLDFVFETHPIDWHQPCGTVNYTVSEDYTRITEFKHLTGQDCPGATTIMKEYPRAFEDATTQVPYYAILSDENRVHYERYLALTSNLRHFHPLGRLAEYRYYNMDVIVGRALALADRILGLD